MDKSRLNPLVPIAAAPHSLLKSCILPVLICYAVYTFYLIMSPLIHAQSALSLAPEKATAWARWATFEHDGHEVEVMFVALCASLCAVYYAASRIGPRTWSFSYPTGIALLLPAAASFVYLHSPIVRPPGTIGEFFLVLCGGICLAGVHFFIVNGHVGQFFKSSVRASLWIGMISMLLLTAPPSVMDYSFYLSPALKLLQGEHFRNFYSQYGFGGDLLFAAMAKCALTINQMQLVMTIVFIVWLIMYQRIASMLFIDKFLAYLFISTFFIAKYCGNGGGGCLMFPQVSPLRLDLWVPILLVAARFGLFSAACSLTISIIYLSDNFIGALFFFAYGLYCLFFTAINVSRKKITLKNILVVAFPVILALCLQYLVFGTFFSRSAVGFHSIKLGFLPIDNHSLFWPILVVLFVSLSLLTKLKVPSDILLMLYGAVALESIYFLGRSHDFNLLNISGIFLFILFFALDRLGATQNNKIRTKVRIGAAIILVSIPFYVTNEIKVKLGYAHAIIEHHAVIRPDSIEIAVSQLKNELKTIASKKITAIGISETYFNYRLGMPEIGPVVPFCAHVEKDETSRFLLTLLDSGYTAVIPNDEIYWIDDLNSAGLMIADRNRFIFHPIDHFSTLGIAPY